jgi:hypothetical protein
MQSRIQGAVLDLHNVFDSALYMSRDLMTMRWRKKERAQDEHID